MNILKIAAVCIALSSPALADGPGGVTATRTQGTNSPFCFMFQTNRSGPYYGVSTNSPTIEATMLQVFHSFDGLCALTFDLANSVQECPSAQAVSGVECR